MQILIEFVINIYSVHTVCCTSHKFECLGSLNTEVVGVLAGNFQINVKNTSKNTKIAKL